VFDPTIKEGTIFFYYINGQLILQDIFKEKYTPNLANGVYFMTKLRTNNSYTSTQKIIILNE
jgi:hypothetical protein